MKCLRRAESERHRAQVLCLETDNFVLQQRVKQEKEKSRRLQLHTISLQSENEMNSERQFHSGSTTPTRTAQEETRMMMNRKRPPPVKVNQQRQRDETFPSDGLPLSAHNLSRSWNALNSPPMSPLDWRGPELAWSTTGSSPGAYATSMLPRCYHSEGDLD